MGSKKSLSPINYEIIHDIDEHDGFRSFSVEIMKFHNDSTMKRVTRIIKFTYKSDTFSDSFEGEVWDGNTNKWNHLFDMTDLGFVSQGDSLTEPTEQRINDRINRQVMLSDKGWEFISVFFDLE